MNELKSTLVIAVCLDTERGKGPDPKYMLTIHGPVKEERFFTILEVSRCVDVIKLIRMTLVESKLSFFFCHITKKGSLGGLRPFLGNKGWSIFNVTNKAKKRFLVRGSAEK